MTHRYLRALLAGAALSLTAATAAAAEPAPAADTVLGFTRAQVAAVTLCYGHSTFALAAYFGYKAGRTLEEAKAGKEVSGKAAPMILEEIEKVHAARPNDERTWTETRFVECLAENSVAIPKSEATNCFDISFWVALMVRLHIHEAREAALDGILKKDADPRLREFVGAEYDMQKKGDETKSAIYTVGNFLRCVNLRTRDPQPAPAASAH